MRSADDATSQTRAIEAHAAVVRALADMSGVDDVLRAVARELCALLGASRCSMYLRDGESGRFRGRVGHASTDIDAHVRRLVAGVDADRFTREIVESGEAVLVDDARMDARPVRSTMRDWGVRSMLGLPLRSADEVVGLAFVDDEDERHRFSDADRRAGTAFAELAGGVIGHAVSTAMAQERLRATTRQNRLLRQAALVDEELTLLALRGAGIETIVEVVGERTGKPVALLDAANRPVAHRGDLPRATLSPDAGRGDTPELIDACPERGLPQRLLVAAVTAREQRLGWLVLREAGSAFTALDRHALRRAAALLALELSARQRIVAAERDSQAALVSDLIRGDREREWLVRRGRELGTDLTVPQVLCIVSQGDPLELGEDVGRRLGLDPLPAAGLAEGVALLLPAPGGGTDTDIVAELRSAVVDAIEAAAPAAVAALSEPAATVDAIPECHVQARQVLSCMQTLAGDREVRALTASELGAGRVFLASVDRTEADRFAQRTLGPLSGEDTPPGLLETVHAFLAASRSVRRAASTLDVHENTVRYRLAKAGELTGLDLAANSDDQMTAHLALRVLQLQGRCPWHPTRVTDEPTEPDRRLALVAG